ncbi:MAG: hypothetical protein QM662_08525 [Gordonia sp. (in: high G+C Gram-positive bacteria)]
MVRRIAGAAVLAVSLIVAGIPFVAGCDLARKGTPAWASSSEQQRYYECVADVYGLTATYDEASSTAPDELARVIASGRDLYASYQQLPGMSVETAAAAAGLDADGTANLRCAVTAFGE